MFDFIKIIFVVFFMLLPLANPLVAVTLMMSLGARLSPEDKQKQSREAAKYSFCVMLVSFFCGQLVMNIFGISIPGLRIAGGLIVLIIGFQMLFPAPTQGNVVDEGLTSNSTSLSFIPLTMPGFAGPGTIAMVISIASTMQNFGVATWVMYTSPIIAFMGLCWFLWFCLKSSGVILKKLGEGGIEVISRIMGFLLVCMGVQFCINGIVEIFQTTT
ncbi:MarC family NAAT transporter [Wohlfahrtiimonas larvae]|uniref:UPF0056 membrane protein n=1 Tax=Wohlfahrtiimonas larvae TaxID=1157986 RepID=A0ABP9MVD9_9GAMM|nr:MarC family NAAT transporter [Wohlfahrtiimonas larvae]